MTRINRRDTRLSRQDWLAEAMVFLSNEGGSRIMIDRLCEGLLVTKGSFYAHFKSKTDFVDQLIGYWGETLTQGVIDAMIDYQEVPAKEQLLALMRTIHRLKASKFDTAVRAWAAQDIVVARGVQKVDRLRFEYVRGIFSGLGFRGAELDLRTRLFVIFHSAERSMHLPHSGMKAEKEILLRHEFFTRSSK